MTIYSSQIALYILYSIEHKSHDKTLSLNTPQNASAVRSKTQVRLT